MSFEVEISPQADSDLRGIYEYIAFELLSPVHALGQLERLEESIMNLSDFPERYRLYEKEPWKRRGLRFMPIDNYLVYYIPNEETQVVTIIRVMYGGRDVDRQLGENTND